ncbi:hypothetical protein HNR65_000272 [Desulfosalsimonas propionicica]|uniref:Uncharacterized protein n=1 Tax=Desulfosalsimonas propionicica TaxID=332175 RepID=A0A7W0HJA2_9BACT|nr:hypothetical protein [Desulfosalsimonas propionicica]MBA2879965.1 hypothetical protein [Desulfosalsimonas propionicica]
MARNPGISKFYFDQRDYHLLHIVNGIVTGQRSRFEIQRQFFHYFHPRGIKEMAESRGLRIAYAVIHLLQSLESAEAGHRLKALRALRDEVMCSTSQELQMNTARVLIEIMKELVRACENYPRQLELAHHFRLAASGKPRIVRYFLKQYRLLEMPEAWNHLAFDDHVHDAFTKGRKSPTHLIMDAWIKGVRRLRVIHYNYIRPETAAELMEAADAMGIMIRIGIEFFASFHNRHAQIIWVPRGFADSGDFLRFLEKSEVRNLMEEGRSVSEYQRGQVIDILHAFNRTHRHTINSEFGLEMAPLNPEAFMAFVGFGQASLLHLAKYIHLLLLPRMQERVAELRGEYADADEEKRRNIEALADRMNRMDADDIHHRFLTPGRNPGAGGSGDDAPALMQLSPCELVDRLSRLHSAYRITLNLSNMKVEDVLELLYECRGRISRLEIFNLKDFADCKVDHIPDIDRLQQSINNANVIQLKRLILEIISRLRETNDSLALMRIQKFNWILADMESLMGMYRVRPLKSRIGSDSTGHSRRLPGMGLAVLDTLPKRAQREVRKDEAGAYMVIPFYVQTFFRLIYGQAAKAGTLLSLLMSVIRAIPGLALAGRLHHRDWFAREETTKMSDCGNIVTLSGFSTEANNGLYIKKPPGPGKKPRLHRFEYLRTHFKNSLKVIFGFVPAFLTFYLTHDWWVLACFGAFIWFGITGLRNILQSVMAGGGLRRSPLLQWNDYISWDRITDSLMYTGFSVPLLDYLVKTLMLNQGLGITTATHPVMLYSVMALVNGLYLTSHNLFRGLPREAAFANFFRSVISIPVAFGLSELLGGVLGLAGVVQVDMILQSWAAVISKTASDFVAALIEGAVDRAKNIENRMNDYRQKLRQFLDCYARAEMLFPESEVLDLLERPRELLHSEDEESRRLIQVLIINALDLLYFWMYQPRARTAFGNFVRDLSEEERHVFIQAQSVLKMEREISQMFIDGILGQYFSKPLAFYLDSSGEYLKNIGKFRD